jgi:hypothetical protein
MAALANSKHERYAQELAKGKSATEAMQAAGYSDPRNSTRLTKNDEIARRVDELKARAAEKVEITLAEVINRLIRYADTAEGIGEPSAIAVARASMMDVAKLKGWLVERTENVNFHHDISNSPASEEEWDAVHDTAH